MKVKVDYPNRPKDSKVDITGLGSFENGSTTKVDDARWERFLSNDPDAAALLGDLKTQVTFPYNVPDLEETDESETTGSDTNDKKKES